jgi:hypothetical protein
VRAGGRILGEAVALGAFAGLRPTIRGDALAPVGEFPTLSAVGVLGIIETGIDLK